MKRSWGMRVLVLSMAMLFAFTSFAYADTNATEPLYKVQIGNRVYIVDSNVVQMSRTYEAINEYYVEEVSITLGFNEFGELVPATYNGGIQPRGTITDDGTYVSSAFRWNGRLTYDYKTISNLDCYKPVEYSHKITELDSQFDLVGMQLHGGAFGPGYTSSGSYYGMVNTGDRSYNVSNASSGTYYGKTYGTSYYIADISGSILNTYGTFTYRRKLADGSYGSTTTSPEFSITRI